MAIKRFRPIKLAAGGASRTGSQGRFASGLAGQLRKLEDNFRQFARHVNEQSANVLVDALRPTFVKSQGYCPILTGALVGSSYLETRTFRGNTVAEMGYARGSRPNYAVFVHERTDIPRRPPTRPKFLQSALQEDMDDIIIRIRDGFKEASGT